MANATPQEMISALREKAVGVTPGELRGNAAYAQERGLGVMMESSVPGARITVIAFVDGRSSLFINGSYGVLGAPENVEEAIMAKGLARLAGVHVGEMKACSEFPPPAEGETVFYVFGREGTVALSVRSEELASGTHAFTPLFHAGHSMADQLKELGQKT